MNDDTKKLYYTIGEVARMFGVNTSLIRYWEKEFGKWIKPHRAKSGSRYYTSSDIDQIRKIYHLVKIEGFTLQGAKDALNEKKDSVQDPDLDQIRDALQKTRNFLKNLLDEESSAD